MPVAQPSFTLTPQASLEWEKDSVLTLTGGLVQRAAKTHPQLIKRHSQSIPPLRQRHAKRCRQACIIQH